MPGPGTIAQAGAASAPVGTPPTPSTAQRVLSNQVQQCAQNVAALIVSTEQQKNQAQIAGDVATADTLNATGIELSVQYGDLARHKLKTIDDSAAMTDAIQGFVQVNAAIKSASAQIQSFTAFANTVTQIANTLDTLITSALVKA
jgi:hypothetical protein